MIYFCERIGVAISALVDGELKSHTHLSGSASKGSSGTSLDDDDDSRGESSLDEASLRAHVASCTYCAAEKNRLERARTLAQPDELGPGPRPEVWASIEETLRREGIIKA